MRLMQPAKAELKIPMPDRGNRLFSAEGETIDETMTYYANLIAGGDLVDVKAVSPVKTKEG